VALNAISGFTGDVTLSAVGNPGTATFAPNPATPPGNSALTISGAGVGSYTFDVYGTSVVTPSLVHSDTVNLVVSATPPPAPTPLTPADGAVDVPIKPTYTWSDVGAASYDIEIATDPGFTNIVDSATGLTEASYVGAPLAPGTLHYWHVRPNNACGAGSFSVTFHFTTRTLPCILLVDDDNDSPDTLPYFTAALDSLGYDYDVASNDSPSLGEMAGYEIVIWFSGDRFGGSAGPGGTDEANLATYLDSGGRLFLSSQDYLYDFGLTTFGQTYLGIGSFTSDSGNATTKYGVAGDPIGDGLGPYPLTYPSGFSDYGDIVNADSGASVAFRSSATGGNNLDVDKDGGAWRTVFFGTDWVPIYNNNAANGRQVLDRILQWFGGCACDAVHDADFTWDPPAPIAGQEVTLYGSAAGDAPISFAWDLGDGSGDSGQTITHTYSLAGAYTVVMTATNCTTATAIVSNTVTVAPCLSPTLSLLESDSPVEWGQPVHFTATVTAGTPPLVYTWDFGGDGDGTGTDTATPVYTYTLPGTYTATVTVSNMCGSAQESTVVDVTCIDPEATFTSDSPVELGEAMHFTSVVTSVGQITYTWDFGDGVGASTEANPTYTYGDPGSYTVTLAVGNYCGTAEVGANVEVRCFLPAGEVSSNSPVALGQPVYLTATLTGTGPLTYTWDMGGPGAGTGLDTPTPVFTYTAANDYLVTLVAGGPCGKVTFTETVKVEGIFHYVYLPLIRK
jgi:PKD repeat protein